MKRGLVALALVAILLVLVWGARDHHGSRLAPAHGDVDHPSDCWAHADAHGRRHCAT